MEKKRSPKQVAEIYKLVDESKYIQSFIEDKNEQISIQIIPKTEHLNQLQSQKQAFSQESQELGMESSAT